MNLCVCVCALSSSGFYRSSGTYIEKERKLKDKHILGSCPELKKLWSMKVTVITIIVGMVQKPWGNKILVEKSTPSR